MGEGTIHLCWSLVTFFAGKENNKEILDFPLELCLRVCPLSPKRYEHDTDTIENQLEKKK